MKYEKENLNNLIKSEDNKTEMKVNPNGPSMRYKKISNYILSKFYLFLIFPKINFS